MLAQKYSFWKGAKKAIIGAIIMAIPFLITSFPDIGNLTLGACGLFIVNFLKQNWLNV